MRSPKSMRRPTRREPCPRDWCFGALGLLAVVVLALTWLNNRSLDDQEPVAEAANVEAPGGQ